jgi:hypothetical protein
MGSYMRSTVTGVALLIVPVLSLAAGEDIDFKGVPFGASEQEFTAKHPDFRCSETDARFRVGGDRGCSLFGKPDRAHKGPKHEAGTYAGVPANIMARFYEDRLTSISVTIFSSHFDSVVKALTERYGKPDSLETPIVKNRMGAEFQNVKAQWKRGDVILGAEKYGSSVTDGRVSYLTNWGLAEFQKRSGQGVKKGAGDL